MHGIVLPGPSIPHPASIARDGRGSSPRTSNAFRRIWPRLRRSGVLPRGREARPRGFSITPNFAPNPRQSARRTEFPLTGTLWAFPIEAQTLAGPRSNRFPGLAAAKGRPRVPPPGNWPSRRCGRAPFQPSRGLSPRNPQARHNHGSDARGSLILNGLRTGPGGQRPSDSTLQPPPGLPFSGNPAYHAPPRAGPKGNSRQAGPPLRPYKPGREPPMNSVNRARRPVRGAESQGPGDDRLCVEPDPPLDPPPGPATRPGVDRLRRWPKNPDGR